MVNFSRSILLLLAVAASHEAALAECTKVARPSPSALVVKLNVTETPDTVRMTIRTGPVVDRSVRVYSEPSHTLMAVLIDSDFKVTDDGRSWLDSLQGRRGAEAMMTVPLSSENAAEFVLARSGRPAEDDSYGVWAYGGRLPDQLVVNAHSRAPAWGVSASLPDGEAGQNRIVPMFTLCCSSTNCPEECVSCTERNFGCCATPPCCGACCPRCIDCCNP
jgi:hypothetical protein